MPVGNMLQQNNASKENKVTLIQTDTGEIKLSSAIVKNYLVAGGGNVSDQEVKLFIALCSAQKLNPFIREAHLIKYGSSPATMVVSKDVYQKRADKHPEYKGKKAGIKESDHGCYEGRVYLLFRVFRMRKDNVAAYSCRI